MDKMFSEESYSRMIESLFVRFPSFQKIGAGAYKPGLDRMMFFDTLCGHPHRKYRTIHVAGTNGKGSVSNMLAAALASQGLRVGLYTSPHISDFRERMRIVEKVCNSAPKTHVNSADTPYTRVGRCLLGTDCTPMMSLSLIEKEEVWKFVQRWGETFDHLEMSFFEITTAMAFNWFAEREVDVAVIETGLGGRLDSTNIITPDLSVITNIGLDHCDMLGDTLGEIAFEKAGIIKPETPVVVGESNPETDPVFERKVLYSNLSSPQFMGDRNRIMSLLTFADKTEPAGWERHDEILREMDLQGEYQEKNLRTVLAAMDVLGKLQAFSFCQGDKSHGGDTAAAGAVNGGFSAMIGAIIHTASIMDFHGRWEKLSDDPFIICDIGHNAHGLKYNFHQLEKMLSDGKCSSLIIVYGIVADKDCEAVFPLMPENATYVFTNASGKRALPAEELEDRYLKFCSKSGRPAGNVYCSLSVSEAVGKALELASENTGKPLVYIGGSTFVVSEAEVFLSGKGA